MDDVGGDFAQFQWYVKYFLKMGASWSAQDFWQIGVTQSRPGAFFIFCFRKTWHTSSSLIWIAGVGERGVAGGVNGYVERCSGRVWGVFSNLNSFRSAASCWFCTVLGMVSCSWLSLSDFSTLKQNHWKIIGSLAYQDNSSLLLWSPFPVCMWPLYTRL